MDSAKELYVTLPAGQNALLDSRIRHKKLLKVALEGINHNLVYGRSPQQGEVEHKKVSGILKFKETSEEARSVFILIKV
jgi:hypothetical protein